MAEQMQTLWEGADGAQRGPVLGEGRPGTFSTEADQAACSKAALELFFL